MTKVAILTEYAKQNPKAFVIIDCWSSDSGANHGEIDADEDGHLILTGETIELIEGSDLRVMIPAGTSRNTAAALLRKLVARLNDDDGEQDLLNALEPDEALRRAARIMQIQRQVASEFEEPFWPFSAAIYP